MTLCGLVSAADDHDAIIFSDALVSTESYINNDPSRNLLFDVPYIPDLGIIGLHQKLVIIDGWILVTFSGNVEKGKLVIDQLVAEQNSWSRDIDKLKSFIENIDSKSLAGNSYIFAVNSGQDASIIYKSAVASSRQPFNRIAAIGSGATDFISAVYGDIWRLGSEIDERTSRELALSFMGKSIVFQAMNGASLNEGWGGAMEVAYFTKHSIEKVDNILVRHHTVDATNSGDWVFREQPILYFSKYFGSIMLAAGKSSSRNGSIFVPSLIGLNEEPPVDGSYVPSVVCDVFVIDNKLVPGSGPGHSCVTNIMFNPAHLYQNGKDDPLEESVNIANGSIYHEPNFDELSSLVNDIMKSLHRTS